MLKPDRVVGPVSTRLGMNSSITSKCCRAQTMQRTYGAGQSANAGCRFYIKNISQRLPWWDLRTIEDAYSNHDTKPLAILNPVPIHGSTAKNGVFPLVTNCIPAQMFRGRSGDEIGDAGNKEPHLCT